MRKATYYPSLKKLTYWYKDNKQFTKWGMGEMEAREWVKQVIIEREIVQSFEVVENNKI